jgi:hypothetical protein
MPSWLISLLTSLGGVLVGGLVSALTSYFLNNRANKQQLARDKVAYYQQRQRDEQAYEQQKEREQFAYKRSLQDARSERLRSAYKIILNAAKEYMSVLE